MKNFSNELRLRLVLMLVGIIYYSNFITAQNNVITTQFNIVVQNVDDKLELECTQGCAWKKLSFTLIEGGQYKYVDNFGVYSTKEKESTKTDQSNFFISFERKGEKIYCFSEHGTMWDELSFSCNETNCNAQINNSGVSVINKTKK